MPLPRYFDILNGNRLPSFRYAMSILSGIDLVEASTASLNHLLEIHGSLINNLIIPSDPDFPEVHPVEQISLLELKAIIAEKMLLKCEVCENRCRIDRTSGERGKCGVGDQSFYASEFLHMGEEEELVPSHTVFFLGCTFECVYCQNWDISHGEGVKRDLGHPVNDRLIARIKKRERSARNLNVVGGNPDQHLATILRILISLAREKYSRPIVWNSNLYGTPEMLDLLDSAVDVHLADFKYGSNECGKKLSGINSYWDVITRNLKRVEPVSDILIRHLVLPDHVECCTSRICEWVKENLPDVRFNLMFQYHPEYLAGQYPEINRYLTESEHSRARELANYAGLI